jgi:hypothetical protein
MFRLAYRSFGSYESMAVVHSVDVNATNRGGVRWYEVRRTGGPANPWSIFQQGTYSPDATNRWMGSIAIDEAGNMAMGYSVSKKKSPKVYPGIRYAGRLAGDPLGTMGQGEAVLVNGTGVQTDSTGRWGDYSSMSVDPVDDCTFWFTTEYYAVTGSRTWRTRIGSFRFPGCA